MSGAKGIFFLVTIRESEVIRMSTEDGGTLPVTSTPWFNLLGFGVLLSLAGVFGIRRVRISTK